jgi:serpin B
MKRTTDTMMPIAEGNNLFALDLYAKLRAQDGNLFFSPYSLSTALAMTYAGARGKTAQQMADVLHFPGEQQGLHEGFAALIHELPGDAKPAAYQLAIANALWGQKGYGFLKSFLDLTQQHYGAGLREVDFAKASEEARLAINSWVEEQTQGKIKDLLAPGILKPLTRLVLTNAIYFKGTWAAQFEKRLTRDEPFFTEPARNISVAMMQQTGEMKYFEEKDFQAIELPYKGGRLSMVVFLPRNVDGLPAVEKALTTGLVSWLGQFHSQKVALSLPRFKLTGAFLLNEVLAGMGMPLAFDDSAADFSGLDGGKPPGLFISAVVHKGFVDVNEEGTEAAAATAVVMTLRAARIERTAVFRADHPFLFLIHDAGSGSILFMGRVTNPQPDAGSS